MSFQTCHGNARIYGAWDSPADGSNATLMDANHSITQQKKTRHGRMYVYMAEDIFRNKAAEEMFLPSSSVLVMYLVVKRFVSEVMFFL